MAIGVQAIEYFYTRVENELGKAYDLLAQLASEDIDLLAFSAVPFGPNHVELTIFPDKSQNFQAFAGRSGWTVTGPQHAILIQGDDHLGALAEIHRKLRDAGVRIYAPVGSRMARDATAVWSIQRKAIISRPRRPCHRDLCHERIRWSRASKSN
jgi:hypothetical protein